MISSKADHNPKHYAFQRTQKLYTPPLQKTEPESSWGTQILHALGCIASVLIFLALCAAFA